MTNPKFKPSAPRPMTDEDRKNAAVRAFIQERKMLVQGIAFNLAGNPAIVKDGAFDPKFFAEAVVASADAIMERLYTSSEETEKTAE